ncbi:MAG: hypothetical protein LJE65_05885 [Desulfobacteraceae bacterium]|nr:hypothetical protein [Desulfobacteraceae bacterium]
MVKRKVASAEVIRSLAEYAKENPIASDTAEGIAQWCLKRPVKEVLPALEVLVQMGVWEKLPRGDRVLFRPAGSRSK